MAKKTPLEKFDAEIEKILEEYAGEVEANVGEITEKMGQQGVKLLRSSAKQTFGGSGDYAKSWKVDTQRTRIGTSSVIYSTMPGLPHLLEHGHANRGGGRTAGREHIKPVEEKLIQTFEEEVASKL